MNTKNYCRDRLIFIIAGGQIQDLEFLRSRINEMSPEAIICADGGARHMEALGLVPAMIIGDMDSAPPDLLRRFAHEGALIRRYPAEKDETDTELAFQAALDLHPAEIWIFGALGYRLDHTLANLSLLLKGEKGKVPVRLLDEWSEVFLVTETCAVEGTVGQTVSLLPFYGPATGVTLSGFAYPLKEGTLSMEAPFGISNRLVSARGTIAVRSGRLIVIRYLREGLFPA